MIYFGTEAWDGPRSLYEMFGVENDYFEILGRVQKMENVRPYLTEVALKMNAGMEEERSNTTKT